MPVTDRRLLLVDASGFVFRAYHAISPLSTSTGHTTHAVLGFTRMVLKLLREEQPTHVALAFDKESRKGRLAIDPTYKANRPAPPDDLVEQFARVREMSGILGIASLEMPGWEADDVIATVAKRALAEGWQVRVITGDKDFIQMLEPGIELYDPMKDVLTRAEDVPARLGIQASQMRDYLALIGDAIDNVAKVPGIGPKTAVELLSRFGDVETLLSRLDEVQKPKIREALRSHEESLRRAKQLVSFRADLPLDVAPDSLALGEVQTERARALFTELEFYKLLQELPGMSRAPAPPAPAEPEGPTPVLADEAELARFCEAAKAAGRMSVQGAVEDGTLIGLGLGIEGGEAVYLPLAHRSLMSGASLSPARAVEALQPLLADPAITKVGHGLKALWHVTARAGMPMSGLLEDVELLSYLHNPSRREHALPELSRERLHRELPVLGTGKKATALGDQTVDEVARAMVPAARAVLKLSPILWRELEEAGLGELARTLELPLLPVLAQMEARGIAVDTALLAKLSGQVDAECLRREKEIHQLAGDDDFAVGSNQQLAKILFEKLGLPIIKKGKTGPSVDQEVLEKLSELHPLPRAVIEYRSVLKLKSTYLDTLPALVDRNGRIHTTFHQAVAATGRLSSSDPNLQNIPIRTELGREIRRAFVAAPGMRLISADYSQVELRILAHVAEDPGLLQAFREGADVHTRTAAEVFAVPESEVTADQRRVAKMVNFGIAYGLSAHGLSTRLNIPQDEARDVIQRYFERYPGIRNYLTGTVEQARKTGYVETLFGRRRPMADLHSKNRMIAQGAERAAINMPIQGTAADLIKRAMLVVEEELLREGLEARMLLQVHDELLFEAPEGEVERVAELARRCMSGVATLKVPLDVEVGVGPNWSDAH